MKIYFCTFLILLTCSAFGQLAIDSTTRENFKVGASSRDYKILATETDIYQNKGTAVITNFKEDTLNHNDYIDTFSKSSRAMVEVDLMHIDSAGKKILTDIPSHIEKNIVVFAKTKIIQDTLSIMFSFPDPNRNYRKSYEILLNITANKSNIFFVVNDSKENSFRKRINTESKNRIMLTGRLEKLVLDRIPKNKNEEFYGEVIFVTDDYFEADENFKIGYLHKQHRVNLHLKCRL